MRHVGDNADQALHDVIGVDDEVQRECRHRRNQHANDEAGPLRAADTGEQRGDEVRGPDLDRGADAHQPRRAPRVSGQPRDREEQAERRDAVELSVQGGHRDRNRVQRVQPRAAPPPRSTDQEREPGGDRGVDHPERRAHQCCEEVRAAAWHDGCGQRPPPVDDRRVVGERGEPLCVHIAAAAQLIAELSIREKDVVGTAVEEQRHRRSQAERDQRDRHEPQGDASSAGTCAYGREGNRDSGDAGSDEQHPRQQRRSARRQTDGHLRGVSLTAALGCVDDLLHPTIRGCNDPPTRDRPLRGSA